MSMYLHLYLLQVISYYSCYYYLFVALYLNDLVFAGNLLNQAMLKCVLELKNKEKKLSN